MVASAASLIYLACHKKIALPNSYFIFHQGSCSNVGGTYDQVQSAMEDYRKQVEKMEKFYIENTTYPEEVIKEKIKSDWYIRGNELLENGVVDVLQNVVGCVWLGCRYFIGVVDETVAKGFDFLYGSFDIELLYDILQLICFHNLY